MSDCDAKSGQQSDASDGRLISGHGRQSKTTTHSILINAGNTFLQSRYYMKKQKLWELLIKMKNVQPGQTSLQGGFKLRPTLTILKEITRFNIRKGEKLFELRR